MKKRALKVGIFDSGIGGLSVLDACKKLLPEVKFYYYGDNHRAPYGNRSEEEILCFTREAFDCFLKLKVDAAVIACNTATACAVDELRRAYPFPVVGMEPAVKPAAQACKRVLVLTTKATAQSARMQMLMGRFPNCEFTLWPCQHLALAIEKFVTVGENFLLSAHLPEGKFDGVVLGCTHYSIFAHEIAAFYSAPVFDGNQGTAKRLKSVLKLDTLGTAAHCNVKKLNQNTNNCLNFYGRNRIKFIGKSRKINKNAYFRTFVLSKTKENRKKVFSDPKKVGKSG